MKKRNLFVVGLQLVALASSLTSNHTNKEELVATREIKNVKTEVSEKVEFDYFKIDDSVENKVSAEAVKSFDASIFDDIDEVNINDNNKVEIKYEVELDAIENVVVLKAHLNKTNESIIDVLYGAVISTEKDKYDVVFSTEDGDIYLSELEQNKTYEECGWFSRLIRRIVEAVVISVVPSVVKPVVCNAIAVTKITEIIFSKTNYFHNRKLDNEVTEYIYNQNESKFMNWKVGLASNIYDTGCGYIATYNTLNCLGRRVPFSKVVYEFDKNEGTNAFGFFGADPSHIGEYFDKLKIKYQKYKSYESLDNALKKVFSPQMVILCYWNSNSIWDGAHYISFDNVSYDSTNNKYSANTYNFNSENGVGQFTFGSSQNFSDGGNIIISYIVTMENFSIA